MNSHTSQSVKPRFAHQRRRNLAIFSFGLYARPSIVSMDEAFLIK